MQLNKKVSKVNYKNLRILPLAGMMFFSLTGFAQEKKRTEPASESRVELTYKQRHSPIIRTTDLYADGIKIKRDLSILKEIQEERVLAADELPADDIYGGIWSNAYVNSYRSLQNVPDTFKVDLSNFSIPHTGYVTSNFGPRRKRMHYGIDLKVQVGDTIYATFDGKVRLKNFEKRGYGYYVVMRHNNGLETVYGHLSEFLVDEGDVVKAGTPIALGGNTGRSTGSHLHFEMRYVGKPINPASIIDFDNKTCYRDSYTITPNTFDYPTKILKAGRGDYSRLASKTRTSKTTTNKYASGKVGYHRVKSGDTLVRIAKNYGMSVSKLCSLNNITTKSKIKPGKSLRVS